MNTTPEPGESVAPRRDLSEASLSDLLIYGLTLDGEDPDLGVLIAARGDLGLMVSLAQNCPADGAEIDMADWADGLERIGRRLDVTIELLTRARRARTTGGPVANELGSTPEGELDAIEGGRGRD